MGAPAWARMAGIGPPHLRSMVSMPFSAMASRAFTERSTSAVSNWLASARTKAGIGGELRHDPNAVAGEGIEQLRPAPDAGARIQHFGFEG